MKSRYDEPEYRKQVALQMLGTPTLEIACRAITDMREQRKSDQVYIADLLQRIKDLDHALVGCNKAFTDAATLWQNATHDHREHVKELEAELKRIKGE